MDGMAKRLARRRAPRTALGARIVAGAVFVLFGLAKFVAHSYEVAEFQRFGFPDPGLLVYAVGTLEVVGGVALLAGIGVRTFAILLAANMAGAVATAGLTVGGPIHLGLAPALLLTALFLVWAGGPTRRTAARPGTAGRSPAADERKTGEAGEP